MPIPLHPFLANTLVFVEDLTSLVDVLLDCCVPEQHDQRLWCHHGANVPRRPGDCQGLARQCDVLRLWSEESSMGLSPFWQCFLFGMQWCSSVRQNVMCGVSFVLHVIVLWQWAIKTHKREMLVLCVSITLHNVGTIL